MLAVPPFRFQLDGHERHCGEEKSLHARTSGCRKTCTFRVWMIPASSVCGCPSLRAGAFHRSRMGSARHSVYSSTTKCRLVLGLASTSSTQTTPSTARRYTIDLKSRFRLLNEHRGAQSSSEAKTRTKPSAQATRKCVPPASATKSASSKKLHGRSMKSIHVEWSLPGEQVDWHQENSPLSLVCIRGFSGLAAADAVVCVILYSPSSDHGRCEKAQDD
jgi:hypothetical protein